MIFNSQVNVNSYEYRKHNIQHTTLPKYLFYFKSKLHVTQTNANVYSIQFYQTNKYIYFHF